MSAPIVALGEIFGLPAHPLVVHAAVVLVPLALVAAIVAISPRVRRPMLGVAAVLAVAGAFFVLAATNSGESLEDGVESSSDRQLVHEHAEAGERAQAPSVLLAGAAVLAFAAELNRDKDRKWRGKSVPTWAPKALLAATVAVGVVATATVVDAGHSGAKSVWDKVSVGEGDDD